MLAQDSEKLAEDWKPCCFSAPKSLNPKSYWYITVGYGILQRVIVYYSTSYYIIVGYSLS